MHTAYVFAWWIGPNTEYLTDLPYTTTVNSQPTVTKAPAAIVAVTATANSPGINTGDVSIALSPKVIDVFNKLLSEAQAACGGGRKRASCDINQRFAQRVAEEAMPGGAFDFIGTESRASLPFITGSDFAFFIGQVKNVSPLLGIAVTWALVGKLQAWTVSSASVLGGKGNGEDDGCPADAPKGDDAPSCDDDECKGDGKKCQQGKYKGCDCLVIGRIGEPYDTDTAQYDDGLTWLDLQQKILDDFVNEYGKGPFCNHGASPRGTRIPKEYCNCGDGNRKTLTYSVASSTASPYNACPYTTNDGPTVTFQPESTAAPSPTPVVDCAPPQERWFSSTDGFDWINQFCNMKGDRTLKLRQPARGMLYGAVEKYFNENKDPQVRIYAFLDDACRDKGTMAMSSEDCARGLDAIMHDCDKGTEEKKMGGSVAINCQWYNIAAFKGPGNPTCNGIPTDNENKC
ncbi:hypothetical protein FB567DRAFT_587217 [Paraphoma chrysanthemicola]|uniref:Uncharacterized protein n=1 Tax=Paraphoma chrysanthemicola TaxID=798071 RepID=A0A8K0RMK3_9PLEO|nr:hypothetical protein FB567DRAFT_587217 [Paraphoma chrysanthemicola]